MEEHAHQLRSIAQYRSIGTEHVEMSAVMAEYNSFAGEAGMKKIAEQSPVKEAFKSLKLSSIWVSTRNF